MSEVSNDKLCLFWWRGLVGYTMRDIRYKWNSGEKSVGISNEVQLPQFRVLGHRQRSKIAPLSTGKKISTHLKQIKLKTRLELFS